MLTETGQRSDSHYYCCTEFLLVHSSCRDAAQFHEAYLTPTMSCTDVVSLIKILMKSQEEESKTPGYSKINQLKPRTRRIHLYASTNPYQMYVHLIVKYYEYSSFPKWILKGKELLKVFAPAQNMIPHQDHHEVSRTSIQNIRSLQD